MVCVSYLTGLWSWGWGYTFLGGGLDGIFVVVVVGVSSLRDVLRSFGAWCFCHDGCSGLAHGCVNGVAPAAANSRIWDVTYLCVFILFSCTYILYFNIYLFICFTIRKRMPELRSRLKCTPLAPQAFGARFPCKPAHFTATCDGINRCESHFHAIPLFISLLLQPLSPVPFYPKFSPHPAFRGQVRTLLSRT